jgi:uncharacterized membrane protein YdjX (TVP38/TMEM64 family)
LPRVRRKPAWGKIALIALVVALLAAAWRWTPLADYVTAERFVGWTRAVRNTWWAPIVLILSYVPAAFVLLPRPIVTLVIVMTYGVLLGIVYATTGVLLAALVTCYAGRVLPRGTLRRLAGDAAWTVFGDQIRNALEDSSKVSYGLIGGALVLLVVFTLVARRFLAKRFKSAS